MLLEVRGPIKGQIAKRVLERPFEPAGETGKVGPCTVQHRPARLVAPK